MNKKKLNKKIMNLYRADIRNPGDFFSPPTRYLHFENYETLFYDCLKLPEKESYICDLIIIGGGGLFGDSKWVKKLEIWLNKIQSKYCVAWGVHIDKKFENLDLFNRFDLIGCRSKKSIYQYVPCASCLHPIFEKYKNVTGSGEVRISHFKRMIPKSVSINLNPIEKNVHLIANSKKVITTSYHIWYWAKLLNKDVEIYDDENFDKPLTEKMYTLPKEINYSTAKKLNISFAKQVLKLLKNDSI